MIRKLHLSIQVVCYVFDGEIPDYRLIGKPNPDKTFETPDWYGLTRFDCIYCM